MNSARNQYEPDHVSPPGQTLNEALEERAMTQVDLAQRIGVSRKHVGQMLEGLAPITPETALKLERVLGTPARFWNNREQQYRDFLARKAEDQRLNACRAWLNNFKHLKKMVELGWLPEVHTPVERVRAVLSFFGVTSPDVWESRWGAIQVQYRRSHTYDRYALAAWLRRGELQAQAIDCAAYDEARFRGALERVRTLTLEPPETFQPKLVDLCAACGVAIAFVPELPKTASGATRWLSPHKALIQLSLKYKTDDQLWFTFFHEAAHILLHPKKRIFIEAEGNDSDQEEEEANSFAARALIPSSEFQAFIGSRSTFTKAAIQQFARSQGIGPGIVVGQLQHAKALDYRYCNDLKGKLRWGTAGD